MKVVVVGAGVTGLTAAYRLSLQGNDVTVLEKETQIGGALATTAIQGYCIENFYHHVFLDDKALFNLLEELNLKGQLEWRMASTAFYKQNIFHKFTSSKDMLLFRLLGLADKASLVMLMLKVKTIKDFTQYDSLKARDFIIKNGSRRVYEILFEPLLKSKFGKSREKVSAAWLIKRLQLRSNRSSGGERLGYMKKGFCSLIQSLENRILKNGGKIITGVDIARIDPILQNVETNKGVFHYEKLISTIYPPMLYGLAGLNDKAKIEYQGSLCLLLSLKKSISSTYWTNVMEEMQFGAIIEHTNMVPASRYNGEHLVYLASYHSSSDPIWNEDEKAIVDRHLGDLNRISKLTKKDINWCKLFRYQYSGLVYKTGNLRRLPAITSSNKNIIMAGMFCSYPERSINQSIEYGEALSKIAAAKPLVCITIPVYNEEKVLEKSIIELKDFLAKNFNYPHFIVIADNASKDRTRKIGELLAKRFKEVKYIYIPVKGRGIALRTTWNKYRADIYSYMDVDLSTGLEAFPKLIDLIHVEGYDVVTGDRLSKSAKTTRCVKREVLSQGYNLILKVVFNQKFKDAQCGFKAVSSKMVKLIMPKVKDNYWFFDTELMLLAEHAGYRIGSLPVTWLEDPDTKVKAFQTVVDYLSNIRRLRKEISK